MEYDYTKIVLKPWEIRLLRRLKHHGPQTVKEFDLHSLFLLEVIQPSARCQEDLALREIEITDRGERYLIWRFEDMFRHRWPVYLSIAAFVLSVFSTVWSVLH